MQIITATDQTQGARGNDFCFTVPGELVMPGTVCDTDRDDPDGYCGCARSWVGLFSHRGTTTATVRDLPGFTTALYATAIRACLDASGADPAAAVTIALELAEIAAAYTPGVILERRADEITEREAAPA